MTGERSLTRHFPLFNRAEIQAQQHIENKHQPQARQYAGDKREAACPIETQASRKPEKKGGGWNAENRSDELGDVKKRL